MHDLEKIYTWSEVKEKRIDICYCKCCACGQPQLKKALTVQQKKKEFFFCQKCYNYIKKESIKNVCSKYNVSIETAGKYKITTQLHKQESKLSNDQKIVAKIANFQKDVPKSCRWGYSAFYEKFSKDPKCYLTGSPINLNDVESWSLDHIVPKSKGGTSKLSNCGITLLQINLCKHSLTQEEFIELCKKVTEFNVKV